MNRRSLLLGAGATLAGCGGASSLPLSHDLDTVIASALRRIGTPGLSVAAYSPDGVYARGFGVSDVTTGARADADTAFYIASCTKPLTALALASMAERGEIDLDATLSAFAPDAPFPAAVRPDAVRLQELLSHTSGIANDAIAFRLSMSGQHDPQLLWRLLGASSANTQAPQGTYEYTNAGYNIATILTDRRFAMPWQDVLQREIFAPAGMTHASARISRAVEAGWSTAKPHGALPEGVAKLYLEKTDATMHSAGGVIMSANDAVRWLELVCEDGVVAGRRAVPAAAVQATRARLAAVSFESDPYQRDAYGLGWTHGAYRGETMLMHFGAFPGFRAHVSYIPARRTGVAVFVNELFVSPLITDAVANYIYDRTAGRRDAPAALESKLAEIVRRRDEFFASVPVNRAERAARPWRLTRPKSAYAGAYENEHFGRIDIAAEGDRLTAAFGVLHSIAEPFKEPDSIRVEFSPYSGESITFESEGPAPRALRYDGQDYQRI